MQKSKLRIATRFYIVDEYGVPCGPMMDFYSGGPAPVQIVRNPYPFRSGQGNGFEDMESAEIALKKMHDHVDAVLSAPVEKRVGSSKWWKE